MGAIHAFEGEEGAFPSASCQATASRFSRANFETKFSAMVRRLMS
jgi:hypothetical protein